MPNPDPFTAASAAILDALSASSAFIALVAPGNLIDMTSPNFEKFKSTLKSGDTPEVVLLPETFTLQPFGSNSRVASLSQAYQLIATHDSLRVTAVNALKFAAMTALMAAGTDLGLTGLVSSWEIKQGRDDPFGEKAWRRGTQRWVSIMSICVYMQLDRATLLAS